MSPKRKTLFDPAQAAGPRKGLAVGSFSTPPGNSSADGKGNSDPSAMTVTALVGRIKNALSEAFPTTVTVTGQLSNLSTPASGHVYFSLKDANASIGAAMWKPRASKLKFTPEDGMEVIVEGKIDIYDSQGKLQLYVERMTPVGQGALELAFQQLKEKLEREGLFDQARKKPIPRFPRGIGLVTSATGAAVRDIQRTLIRRWPGAKVFLYPSLVQGDGAAENIAEGIRLLDANAAKLGIDTIIVARGGGSLEDLWAFNEEVVARAVSTAGVPIISGVGHEVDVSICDLVADVRAATPTAAAELAVPDGEEVRRTINALDDRLARRVRDKIDTANAALASIGRSEVFRNPAGRVRSYIQRVDELSHRSRAGLHGRLALSQRRLAPLANRLTALHPARLADRARAKLTALTDRLRWVLGGQSKRAGDKLAAVESRLAVTHPKHGLALARQQFDALESRLVASHPQSRLDRAGQQLIALHRQLEAMSYRNVLKRGYSVTRSSDGKIRRSITEFAPGDRMETELADGRIQSDVVADGAPCQNLRDNSSLEQSAASAHKPALPPMENSAPKRKSRKKSPPENTPNLFDGF